MNLNEEELEQLIDRAVEKALDAQERRFYVKIGEGVVTKGLWVIGVGVAFLGYVIYNHGWPK